MNEKFRIDPAKFTVVLTSCGRFDLLEDTISSFLEHFDVDRIIVAEDSGDQAGTDGFAAKFPLVEMRLNVPKLGQMGSIDAAYASITTPYIVHLEDDWHFNRPTDLDAVVRVLEANRDVSAFCIANGGYAAKYAPFAKMRQAEGLQFRLFDLDVHPEWFSHSFNPSVTPAALWKKHGPISKYVTEAGFSGHLKKMGMRIAHLDPSSADHTGGERHVPDPYQPVRAKTFWGKLMRSIRKRMRRLRGAMER